MIKTISSRERLSPQSNLSPDLISAQHHSDEVKVNRHTSQAVAHTYVQPFTGKLQIVHATNGRIRIRATDGSFDFKLESISQHLKQYKGVKEVSANEQTGSLIITFDEKKLSLPQMLGILRPYGIEPQTSPQSRSNVDPFAAWKSIDYWKEQTISFIPLMTGLAVTGGLGISGLAAIPVYMITSDATRRVIDYLEPQLSPSPKSNNSVRVDEKSASQSPLPTGERKSVQTNQTSQTPLSKVESKPVAVEKGRETTAQPAKIDYSIVHEIPGRIRFHLPRLAQDRAYGRRLERLLKTDAKITSVRVNSDAASIAIAYAPSNVKLSHWVSLMELALETNSATQAVTTTARQPEAQPLSESMVSIDSNNISIEPTIDFSKLLTQPKEVTTTQTQTLNISSLWADMKPSALSIALDYMANLPL